MLEEPLCRNCAWKYWTKIRVTAYLCLYSVLKRDVSHLIVERYLNNPFVMNPISHFIEHTSKYKFMIVLHTDIALDLALKYTRKSVSLYEDDAWGDIVVLRKGEEYPVSWFFTELLPKFHEIPKKLIICGTKQEGMLDVIPKIVNFVKVY